MGEQWAHIHTYSVVCFKIWNNRFCHSETGKRSSSRTIFSKMREKKQLNLYWVEWLVAAVAACSQQ